MIALDVVTATDYSDVNQVTDQEANLLDLTVANAGIYARFRPYDPERQNLMEFGDEFYIAPCSRLYGGVAGIEVRSAVADAPAHVIAQLLEPGDPQPFAAASVSFDVAPDGSVAPVGGSVAMTGIVNADGSIAAGSGFTVNHTGTGVYVVTFATAFGSTPVVLAAGIASNWIRGPQLSALPALTGFTVDVYGGGTSPVLNDLPWLFVAQASQ